MHLPWGFTILLKRIHSQVTKSGNPTPRTAGEEHCLVRLRMGSLPWPIRPLWTGLFPWATATIGPLTLQGGGGLSWLVMPTQPPPIVSCAPAASSTLNMLSSLLLIIPTPISSQLPLPKGSFSNFPNEVKSPKAYFHSTQNLPFMESLSDTLV